MAEKQESEHSGFEAPVIGVLHPVGTTVIRNADGTIELREPAKIAAKRVIARKKAPVKKKTPVKK